MSTFPATRSSMASSTLTDRQILRSIQAHAGLNAPPPVERDSGRRPLHYRVIDGLAIRDHLPQLEALSREVNGVRQRADGRPPCSDAEPASTTQREHHASRRFLPVAL
jgi:hypothetical protein